MSTWDDFVEEIKSGYNEVARAFHEAYEELYKEIYNE